MIVTQAPEAVYYPGFRYIPEDGEARIDVLLARVLDELAARREEHGVDPIPVGVSALALSCEREQRS